MSFQMRRKVAYNILRYKIRKYVQNILKEAEQ